LTQATECLTFMRDVPGRSLAQGRGYPRCVHSSSHANAGIIY